MIRKYLLLFLLFLPLYGYGMGKKVERRSLSQPIPCIYSDCRYTFNTTARNGKNIFSAVRKMIMHHAYAEHDHDHPYDHVIKRIQLCIDTARKKDGTYTVACPIKSECSMIIKGDSYMNFRRSIIRHLYITLQHNKEIIEMFNTYIRLCMKKYKETPKMLD